MVEVGSVLHYINKFTRKAEYIVVTSLDNNGFSFFHNGILHKLPFSALGKRLFVSSTDMWIDFNKRDKPQTPSEAIPKPPVSSTGKGSQKGGGSKKGLGKQQPPKQPPSPIPQKPTADCLITAAKTPNAQPPYTSVHPLDDKPPREPSPTPPDPSCDNCQLRRSETCTLIRAQLCDDYKAVPWTDPKTASGADTYDIEKWPYGSSKNKGGFENPRTGRIWGGK